MAQRATDVKAALDKKGQKEVAEQQGSSIIKYSNLAYVQEEDFGAFIKPKSAESQPNYLDNFAPMEGAAAASATASQPKYIDNFASDAAGLKISQDSKQQPKPAIPAKPPIPAKPGVPYIPQYSAQAAAGPGAGAQAAQPAKPIVVIKPIDSKEVQMFLNHIAWGRQEEAEALLKTNKDLALVSGSITDHAKRTFNNITGFQLTVWNLDWKMWSMILPYLPKDAAIEQAKGFKTGSWVKEQGEHATWKKLTDALQVYIDKYSGWSWDQCKKHWLDEVGNGGQLPSPMHVLQEYCNPGRPFEPCPDFSTQYTLQRTLPDWLSSAIPKGKFDFGLLRYNFSGARSEGDVKAWRKGQIPAGRWRQAALLVADRRALISLYNTRAQQRGELIASLLSNELRQTVIANKK